MRAVIGRLPPVEQNLVGKAVYAGHFKLSQLVAFSNQDGRLFATFHLPEELTRQFRDPASLLISLEGSPHAWVVYRRKAGTLDTGLSLVTLTCYAPDELWPFNRYSVSSDGTSVMVAAAQMFGQPRAQPYLTLSQGERTVRVAFRLEADKYVPRTVDAVDLNQLSSRVPNLVDRYLGPVFRRIGAGMAASDVYRVFDQIPADAGVTREVWGLVKKLDSDDSVVRDAALRALKEQGRPAILACLRLDAGVLSPEQKSRLEAFYASNGWIHVGDVEGARKDANFLAACQEDEDQAVREAAGHMLAALVVARQLR
jgi:hypothetical protein